VGGWWIAGSLWAGHAQFSSVLEVMPGSASFCVYALHGEGGGWVVGELLGLFDLWALGHCYRC
jgi:hypothetical protein